MAYPRAEQDLNLSPEDSNFNHGKKKKSPMVQKPGHMKVWQSFSVVSK